MSFCKTTIPYPNTYLKMPNPLWNKSSDFIGNTGMWIGNTNENAGFRIDTYKSPKYEMRLDLKNTPNPGWKC